MSRAPVPVLMAAVAVGLVAATVPAVAQATPADSIPAVYQGGNEWWVQIKLTSSATWINEVQVRDEGGSWKAMSVASWDKSVRTASFHIEPGHKVSFRYDSKQFPGQWRHSCWFEHPSGREVCHMAGDPFTATYSDLKGNNWWVQVDVDANKAIRGVDARVNGGTWKALTLKSWGDWAASFHVPTGSVVEFRTTATDGSTHTSSKYTWPPR